MSDTQDLEARIAVVEGLDLAGLQAEYLSLFGAESTSKNPKALRSILTRKLQRMRIDARKQAGKGEAIAPAPEPAPKPKTSPKSDTTVLKRIAELQGHSIPRLREEYERMYGRPSSSRNKRFLLKKIAEAVRGEVGAEPGKVTLTAKFERKKPTRSKRITKPVKQEEESKRASHREPGERDPRLPKPGTTLTRHYKGKDVLVRVLDEGFEHAGKTYRSLSAVAMAITGAKAINGFLWFQLGDYAKKEKAAK